jgi:hypothetical protein
MLRCANRQHRSGVVKPSRSEDKAGHQSKAPEDDLDQSAAAEAEVELTPEERARLLVELEAELENAERSIQEEGTISAKELLKQRAAYWAGLTPGSSERDEKAPRRQRR